MQIYNQQLKFSDYMQDIIILNGSPKLELMNRSEIRVHLYTGMFLDSLEIFFLQKYHLSIFYWSIGKPVGIPRWYHTSIYYLCAPLCQSNIYMQDLSNKHDCDFCAYYWYALSLNIIPTICSHILTIIQNGICLFFFSFEIILDMLVSRLLIEQAQYWIFWFFIGFRHQGIGVK